MELDLHIINEAIDYFKSHMWTQYGAESIEEKAKMYATAIIALEEIKKMAGDVK